MNDFNLSVKMISTLHSWQVVTLEKIPEKGSGISFQNISLILHLTVVFVWGFVVGFFAWTVDAPPFPDTDAPAENTLPVVASVFELPLDVFLWPLSSVFHNFEG